MKKHFTNGKNIIDVYTFMRMSGLECKHKKNVRVSHSIMEKKLNLRHNLFPEEIILPKKVSFDDYINEDVLKGKVLEVIDDYNRVIAYYNPLRFKENQLISILINTADKKSLEKIRRKILKEQGYIIQNNGEIICKEDYQKYINEDNFEVTENYNRCKIMSRKLGRSMRCK